MPTFLHAADLHLDSPLRGLERKQDAPVGRIREASRIAFERLVDAALDEQVAFVLLAGDIYDTRPAFETYLFFHRQMERLGDAGIPVAIVLGNHDHDGVAPRAERLPDGVHVLPHDQPASIELVPGVWVHGQSYPRRDVDTDLSAAYPAAVPGALNIGLLHTALDGYSGGHARYAPSHKDQLAAHGYQYWALGHVHAPTILNEQGCHIVYPGNLQGRHVRETGAKGAMFVEYADHRITAVTHRSVDDVRWHLIEIDVAELAPERDALHQVVERIDAATAGCRNEGRLAAIRVRLHGAATAELLDLGAQEIRDSLRALTDGKDTLFLERIDLDLHPAGSSARELDRHLDELNRSLATETALLEEQLEPIRKALRTTGGPELLAAWERRAIAEHGSMDGWLRNALRGGQAQARELLRQADGRKRR